MVEEKEIKEEKQEKTEKKERSAKGKDTEQKKEMAKPKEDHSIIYIAGRDIRGDYDILHGLRQIKGIGSNIGRAIAIGIERKLNIKMGTKLDTLSDEQIAQIEAVLSNPTSVGVPAYLLNRRSDIETGKDIHLVSTDLIVRVKQDIERDVKMQSYRGFRHQYGQKVRGQRTRSTGRTGATVGVTKSKLLPATAGAGPAAGGKKEEEKKK